MSSLKCAILGEKVATQGAKHHVMVQTPSNMMPLGTLAPDFTLPDTVSGKDLSLQDLKGEYATLIMFICNHCPFVKHIKEELAFIYHFNDFADTIPVFGIWKRGRFLGPCGEYLGNDK